MDEIKDIELLRNEILSKYPSSSPANQKITNYVPLATDFETPTQSFEGFSNDTRGNALIELSDGSYIDRYDRYFTGVNNDELNAQSQSSTDKWINGIAKFGGKTFNAVIGGTVGTVYGIGEMIQDGSLTSLYDNGFTRTLDDWNTKMDYNLPNYYTEQEQAGNLFEQATTANFWSDKVLGGLSFTAGAIVSEAIWAYATGGASLGTTGARLGAKIPWATKALGVERVAQGVAKSKDFLRSPLAKAFQTEVLPVNTAVALGKAGDLLNTTRFMVTSAGYEASVEALQYRKEQQENFYANFSQQYGRQPSFEEVSEFEQNLTSSSNAVFGLNLGIVGTSNLAVMGNIVGLRNPINTGISDFIERKAFGRGITQETTDGVTKAVAIQATRPQKVARAIFDYGKAPVVEGLYEEGGQGVVSKTAGKWLEHSYNPLYANENIELSGLVYESLAEQYGTKEGWVENGVGLIIGALGGTANTIRGNRQQQQEQEYRISGVNTFTEKVIGERLLMANRIAGFSQQAETESQLGNIAESRIASDGVLHARINHSYQLGDNLNNLVGEAQTALNTMSVEQFAEAGVEVDNIEDYKAEVLQEYKSAIDNFKTNRKFAEYTIGRADTRALTEVLSTGSSDINTNNREALVQALTWNLTAGDSALRLMNDARTRISQEVGQAQTNVINTIEQLSIQEASLQNEVGVLRNRHNTLTVERDNLQKNILELQNAPRETEGDRVAGAELAQRNIRLLELNEEINNIETDLSTIAENINSQNAYQDTLSQISSAVTLENLLNLNRDTENLDRFINGLRTVSPQRYEYVSGLLEEYTTAQKIYNDNLKTTRLFSEGKINIPQVNSWLGQKLSKGKTLDETTKEWLIDILTTYQANKVRSSATTIQDDNISQEDYDIFVETGEISEDILEDIAFKIANTQQLSEREKAIYQDKSYEIESILRETPLNQSIEEVIEEQEILSPAEEVRKRLENLLKRDFSSLSYIGSDYNELYLQKPTPKEIEEYRNLRENNTDEERFNFLQNKLSNWKLLDSAVNEDNQTVTDLIDLIEQLETTIEAQNTLDELTSEDIATISQPNKDGVSESTVRYDLAQNTRGSVTAQILKGNTYKFSHLKMTTILDALAIPLERARVVIDGKSVNNIKRSNFENYSVGTIFFLDKLKFTIGAGNTIEMSPEVYRAVKDAVDLNIIIPSVNWSYFDVYEKNGRKKPSDFQEDINPQQIYNIRPNDKLSLRIAQDSFNESLKTASLEQIEKQLKIELVFQGQAVSTLKATNTTVAPTDEFLMLRKMAAQAFIKGERLNASVLAKRVFLGSPQITTENLQNVNINLTNTAIQNIISTGYMQNGQLTLSREIPEVDTTYINNLRNTTNLKIPVIIFRKGAYNIAYPVTLKKSPMPMTERITSILENIELTQVQKVKAINDQIIETGIASDKRLSRFDEAQINSIIEDFAQNETFVSMDNFSNANYRISNAQFDLEINIDLDNLDQVISDPKLEIDLSSISLNIEQEDRYESMIEIENALSQKAWELYSDYVRNADSKYINSRGEIIEDTTYTNAFDNNVVVENPASNIEKLANTRIIREAFSERIPKNLQNIISKETITEVENLLRQYDMIKNQTTPNRETADEIIEDNSCA